MHGLVRRVGGAAVAAMLSVFLLFPAVAGASSGQPDPTVSNHIARALAKAPRGTGHWKIAVVDMQSTGLGGRVGKWGVGIRANTVYGNCGSAWMAIGDQGGGNAWIAFGWDIRLAAWGESWSTGISPYGSSSGGGYLPPWSSKSFDYGYSASEGHGTFVYGAVYMVALLYPGQGASTCTGNPGAGAWIS